MPIRRLYIVCEGQTEEEFVRAVLKGHFRDTMAVDVIPILPSNRARSNLRRHKGGWTSYARLRNVLRREMEQKHDDETWFTTMLDLYAIPEDFPGLADAPLRPAGDRIAALETTFRNDVITGRLWRFTPYLQLHEDETLLLVDVEVIGRWMPDEAAAGAPALTADIAGLSPEEVDGGRETAPSKRIIPSAETSDRSSSLILSRPRSGRVEGGASRLPRRGVELWSPSSFDTGLSGPAQDEGRQIKSFSAWYHPLFPILRGTENLGRTHRGARHRPAAAPRRLPAFRRLAEDAGSALP